MTSTAFFLQRLNDHIVYLTRIKTTLDDKGDFCGTDFHTCKLGEWLYGEGKDQAAGVSDEMLTEFDKLFEPHKAFHEASASAITAHAEGNKKAEEHAFTKMHLLSNTLVTLLLEMDRIAR
ncbi:MAG: hypothetical protein DSZ28_03705 [Thiothrix sp.]|nr:MAG: hypothetical protein DSZ28_03705 [Thiothrix sp.]